MLIGANVGEIAHGVARLVRHLRRVEEQARPALPGQDRIAEGQGGVPHIAAAQVEGPGEVVRIGDDERVELRLRHLLADALELCRRRLAGIGERMRPYRSLRRGRAVDPDHIDEIDIDGRKLSAGTLHRLLQLLQAVAGMKPRIVGEHTAGRQVFGDPVLGRGIGELDRRDHGCVDLLGCLDGVASVDDEGCLALEHDGGAGRAGEAGEPGQALGALRHIFSLMLVGARYHEAVEAAAGHLGTELGDVLGALSGRGGVVEKLELGHGKHHRNRD